MRVAAGLVLLGCTGQVHTDVRPAMPDAVVVTRAPAKADEVDDQGRHAVAVQLKFFNISDLHRGFFSREEAMERLGRDLGGCTQHAVEILISYDNDTRIGRIMMAIPPDSLTCLPIRSGTGVDLEPLTPVGRALARYRDYIAGTSDFRVANFRTGVHFTRGLHACELVLGGQYPPDGRSWSPCVSFAGRETCASDDEGVTWLKFPSSTDQTYLMSCLGL